MDPNQHVLREVNEFEGDLAIIYWREAPEDVQRALADHVQWWVQYEGPNDGEFRLGKAAVMSIRFLRKPEEEEPTRG